jgi:ABC-2 type transport system permease protein
MRAIYLIARREFLSYVATWGFWLSLASLPMFMALGIGLPALIESNQPTRYYVLVDNSGGELEQALTQRAEARRTEQAAEIQAAVSQAVGDNPQLQAAIESQTASVSDERYIRVQPDEAELDQLRPYLLGDQLIDTPDGPQPLFAAIYLSRDADNGINIEYWSTNLTDGRLRSDIRIALRDHLRLSRLIDEGVSPELIAAVDALSPNMRELNPERSAETAEITQIERIPLIIGVGFSIALWMVIFSVVNMLLTAMIEEKGNKILEMMLASCRHHEILMGKLLGVALVSATLLLAWGSLAIGGGVLVQQLSSATNSASPDIMAAVLDPSLLLPAAGYFLIGYLMYGAIFLAIGSLCETLQEAQTLMSPIMLVMMVPLLIIVTAFESPDSAFIAAASWVPIWTPFIMLSRLPLDPPMFEIVATTAIMVGTSLLVLWGSGAVFRMGALNHANQDTVKAWFSFGRKTKQA